MNNLKAAMEVRWQPVPGELLYLGRVFREPLGELRLQRVPKRILGRREGVLLGVFALVLHGAVIYWVSQAPAPVLPVVPPEIPPMTIEFAQPAPPVVETPPPPPEPVATPVVEPPPPVEDELASRPPPPPKPKPKPVVKKEVPKPVTKPVQQVPAARSAATSCRTHAACTARAARAKTDYPGFGQRWLSAQPGARVPGPGHAPQLGRDRVVACARAGQRQAQRDSGPDQQWPHPVG